MVRGKRTSEETKAKVVELKITNPELSSHDIEKKLKGTEWEVSNETVCDIINGLAHLGTTEKGSKQIERLDTIIGGIEEITAVVVSNLRKKEEHTVNDVKMLNDIAKTNFERKQILTGGATDRKEIKVNTTKELSTEELLALVEK